MKFSLKKHKILENLEIGRLKNLLAHPDDAPFFDTNKIFFHTIWMNYVKYFKNDICVISNSFKEAALKAQSQLINLVVNIADEDMNDFTIAGSYIAEGHISMIYQHFKAGSQKIETCYFLFSLEGIAVAMYVDNDDFHQFAWISSIVGLTPGINSEEAKNWIHMRMVDAIIVFMFKSYAEVETKLLPSKTELKTVHCHYRNLTKLNMTYLDSKWFTNLVQSDEFKVRGHFRFQACGKDFQERKLIWIDEFKKKGYTAPARKLNSKT
jgi:hypothetical protein